MLHGDTVTPVGRPETSTLAFKEKPPDEEHESDNETEPPALTVAVVGDRDREKSVIGVEGTPPLPPQLVKASVASTRQPY